MSYINAQPGNATTSTALIKVSDGTAALAFQTNGANLVVINSAQVVNCTTTTAIVLSSGTTAQRPASPVNGMIRYNSNTAVIEAYYGNAWASITT